MRIGNLARFKALYLTKGYDQIWTLIQKLRFLSAGQPGTPGLNFPPTPRVEVTDRDAHWCLSDFDAIISELDKDPAYGIGYKWAKIGSSDKQYRTITAEKIITRLQAVLDDSTKDPHGTPPMNPVRDLRRPLSLRKTILAVAF
jgi:hypothetical protein